MWQQCAWDRKNNCESKQYGNNKTFQVPLTKLGKYTLAMCVFRHIKWDSLWKSAVQDPVRNSLQDENQQLLAQAFAILSVHSGRSTHLGSPPSSRGALGY